MQALNLPGFPREEVEAVAAQGPQVVDQGVARPDVPVAVEGYVHISVVCLKICPLSSHMLWELATCTYSL